VRSLGSGLSSVARAAIRTLLVCALGGSSLASAQTLQAAMDQAMAGRSGGAVAVSAASGRILAIYHAQVVAQRVAFPGSAIKPFVLLELLRSGKVSAEAAFACRRRVQVGKHNLDCQHVRTVEAMNAERALAYSCNSYFTEFAARLDGVDLSTSLRQSGFSAPTYLAKSEATGYVRTSPDRPATQLQAVGEYGVGATPLQMANAYRLLAAQVNSREAAIQTVMVGLRGAVAYGTAQGAQVDGLAVGGKTGTSSAEEGSWTHAWFAGFAPADKPEIVVVIFLERGHGSEAATIAGTLLKQWARGRQ
jgi:cell division protein FtsI/penicillin-binding protein 2